MTEIKAPVIVLVGADKGGVGKTTVARSFVDFSRSLSLSPRIIDTQVPNGDLKGFYSEAQVIDLMSTTGQMDVFDTLPALTVVDVAAGLLGRTVDILERTSVIRDAQSKVIRLVLLYLLGPSVASLNEVVDAWKRLNGRLDIFFVKNHIAVSDYFGWEKDPRFADALQKMAPVMVDILNLDQVAAERVQQRGQPFAGFVRDIENSRMLRGYVSDWTTRVDAEFSRVGLNHILKGE